MEGLITNEERTAMAEVDYIIHHMNERYLNRIPQNVQDYITILKKKNMKIYVDPHIPLDRQGLKEFTLYFLMILNLKYWCDDARRRDILLMLENNQKQHDDKINNINNILENAESMQKTDEERPLNKPREVIIADSSSTVPEKEKLEVESEIVETENEIKEKNALNELNEETDAIVDLKEENFFKKLIHKIKSFLVRK